MAKQPAAHAGGAESPVALRAIVQKIWSQWGQSVPSDLRGDCEVEAELALWRVQPRLVRLPAAEQPRYAYRCVFRAVSQIIRLEVRAREGLVSLDALETDNEALEPVSERDTAAEAMAALPLVEQIERPELAAAVAALPGPDQQVLDLAYRQAQADPELATALRASIEAAKKQRQRAVARARRAVVSKADGGDALAEGLAPRLARTLASPPLLLPWGWRGSPRAAAAGLTECGRTSALRARRAGQCPRGCGLASALRQCCGPRGCVHGMFRC